MQEPPTYICALSGCDIGCETEDQTVEMLPFSCPFCGIPDYCSKKHRTYDLSHHKEECKLIIDEFVDRIETHIDIRNTIIQEINSNRKLSLAMFNAFKKYRKVNEPGVLILWTHDCEDMKTLVTHGKRISATWFTFQPAYIFNSSKRFSNIRKLSLNVNVEYREYAIALITGSSTDPNGEVMCKLMCCAPETSRTSRCSEKVPRGAMALFPDGPSGRMVSPKPAEIRKKKSRNQSSRPTTNLRP